MNPIVESGPTLISYISSTSCTWPDPIRHFLYTCCPLLTS